MMGISSFSKKILQHLSHYELLARLQISETKIINGISKVGSYIKVIVAYSLQIFLYESY